MTACGAIGALIIGGVQVGELRCDKSDGHTLFEWDAEHAVTLTWTDDPGPDADLLDPDESFDVYVVPD